MKKHNSHLVLECIVLATELVRLAIKLVPFLNMVLNYNARYESKMAYKI
jgi:hypothetical protein